MLVLLTTDASKLLSYISKYKQIQTTFQMTMFSRRTITNPLQKSTGIGKAVIISALVWIYTLPWATLPALEKWGRFVPEGFLTTCTFDYLTEDAQTKSFVATLFTVSYVLPMFLIIYFYSRIVMHVIQHEKSLKSQVNYDLQTFKINLLKKTYLTTTVQAKKMNIESLRSNDEKNYAAEIRITKAAVMMCFLFVLSWTPYAIVALIGCFGNK